ncbi:hypothetical protein [Crocinitomix algicola]|uniref:hypothetical protein n=1 Tax=Crocinitomix algicola TaxID=1740263 RepID=UPI00082FA243|nr:hypothetical protein [Crocinitomix algicola]
MGIIGQKRAVNLYFYSLHSLFFTLGLTGYIKENSGIFIVYMLLGTPVFFILYYTYLNRFSSKLKSKQKWLFDKNAYSNPLAPNRNWWVDPFTFFDKNAYPGLLEELVLEKELSKRCLTYTFISFGLMVLLGIVAL